MRERTTKVRWQTLAVLVLVALAVLGGLAWWRSDAPDASGLPASGAVFRVQLDTHSVPLDLHMASAAHLRVDGTSDGGASWDGSAPGGHHRERTLAFTTPVTSGANVVPTISGLSADAVGSWTAP